eukprot:CAMPEP_0206488064 /NCGR_PEP_ID=MMETSP0324_2-20121206/42120_1 /ASSEMBLY_ACC=CAM_ASM_000836 /TAXON_ID=2866 /ORGANISM="Crypthecodinium cohnii, Strain Seligo" /LENGTH=54 /DNA_ID=CAMNT_0053966877 /DNA_START=54 /DNA_END=215 /DNA_ORIENTATION=+
MPATSPSSGAAVPVAVFGKLATSLRQFAAVAARARVLTDEGSYIHEGIAQTADT